MIQPLVSSHSKLANNPPTRCQIFFSPAATNKSSKNPQSSRNPTKKKPDSNHLQLSTHTHTKRKKKKNPPLPKSSTRSSSQQLVLHSANKVLHSKIFSKIGSQELNHTIKITKQN
jgi:hypothetical protein